MSEIEYLNQFVLPALETIRTRQPRQLTEEEYNSFHFGSNYLGNGFVKCDCCKSNAVKIEGYFEQHHCADCQLDLANLT